MDIHQMKIFLSVFTERSITKAAEKLNITQPTISEHIRNMENVMGKKLFIRSGKEMKPTEFACEIFPGIIDLINRYDKFLDQLDIKKESVDKLSIGSSSVPKIVILPIAIHNFQMHYPDVKMIINISDSVSIIEKVKRYEIPLGFVGTVIPDDRLTYEKIFEDELIIACRKGLFHKIDLEIDDLFKYKFVSRDEGSGTRKEAESYLKKAGLSINKFKPTIVTNDFDIYVDLIRKNDFFGFMSKVVAEKKELSIHRIKNIKLKRGIYAIYRNDIELPHEYNSFKNICKSI
ncbi:MULTISPECIES: LysR substrate-binding domain-containing protein [Calditerrivibrio]|uniref:LysR substrate-binding domain-containing protein n=1 Tax=Calditerrivibrio TaxID=545865 RepID=UPI003C75DFF3